jgi:membrane-bound ClpP family serine protease
MPDLLGIVLLYAAAAVILVAELFIPSHGILGLAGLATLAYALYATFAISSTAGFIATAAMVIILPVGFVVGVKTWHSTPIGKRISPPHPELKEEDRLPLENLRGVVGQRGRAVTLLRPVGICDFQGRRLECKAEQNVIQKGAAVEAIGLVDRTIVVRPVPSSQPPPAGANC